MKISSLYLVVFILLVSGCTSSNVKSTDQIGVNKIDQTGGVVRSTRSGTLKQIKMVAPEFPPEARRARLAGVVQVQFYVLPDGSVRNVSIVRSAHPLLDQLAVDAVSQWRYEPYTLVGETLEPLQVPITFSIDE